MRFRGQAETISERVESSAARYRVLLDRLLRWPRRAVGEATRERAFGPVTRDRTRRDPRADIHDHPDPLVEAVPMLETLRRTIENQEIVKPEPLILAALIVDAGDSVAERSDAANPAILA